MRLGVKKENLKLTAEIQNGCKGTFENMDSLLRGF